MDAMEIILLIAGAAAAAAGFLLPAGRDEPSAGTKELAQAEIKSMVDHEMDAIRSHVDDVVDEAVGYAVEKTERSLERLTNEKIMAVNEYSDTVLEEIHKNHDEAMFLYDMLNDKHTSLKNTVTEVNKTVQEVSETRREAEEMVSSFQELRPEPVTGDTSGKIVEPVTLSEKQPAVDQGAGEAEEQSPAGNKEKILELHRQGLENVEIAQRLGVGVGVVRLVLDLNRE